MGNALGLAQFGGTAPTAKPWKGLGPGVLEIVVALVAQRLRTAAEDYEENYGTPKG